MTTGIFFVGVAAIAVLLLMQLFGRRSQALLVAGAALATICIGVGAVRFSSADGGMRLSAEVLRFNGSVDRPVDVTIGGDQLRDELYVRRTTTGVAQTVLEGLLRLRTDDNDDVSLTVRRFGAAPITAVVQIDDTIIGEAPMTSDAEICLRACDRDSAVWIRYDEARNVLVTADGRASGFDLVRRQGSLGLPSPRDWTAVDRIYPLRYFAPPDRTPDAEEGREQVQSFLFRRRDGSLHFVLLDASARMRGVAGAEILGDDRQAAARLCADGEGCVSEAKVRIYEVRFGDPPSQTQTPSRGYLTEMRSFDIVAAPERSVLLRLDTPDSIVLTASDMETESRRLSELGTEASVRIGAGSRLSTDSAFSTVGFTSLGGGFLRDIDHRLLLGDVAAIAYGSQRTEVRSGFSVSMGDRFEAIVRIDKLDSNWPLLGAAQVIIFLGGLVSLLATWRARTASPVTFALFAALDLLLMLRVLVGLQAAFVDPGVEAQAAPVHAFATYLLGPLLLSLVSPATYAAPMRLAAHAGFVAIALVWLHRDIGALDLPFVVISGVGVASALIGALLALPLRTFSMPRFKLSDDAGMNWTLFSAVVALFFLARVVLALSNQEAISLPGGTRMSLSIVYVPLTILVFAWLLSSWERGGREESPNQHIGAFFVTFILLCFVPLLVARDTGAIIYALPFALFGYVLATEEARDDTQRRRWRASGLLIIAAGLIAAGGLTLLTAPTPEDNRLEAIRDNPLALAASLAGVVALIALGRIRPRSLLAVPAASVLAVVLFVNIAPALPANSTNRVEQALQSATVEDDLALLEDGQGFGAGNLRIISLTDRGALGDIGTRESEGLSIALAHMADHSRELWGPGLLHANAPTGAGLARYHMNDNVTSVHVMGAFGRINAALVVFVLFVVLAIAASAPLRAAGAVRGFAYFAGVMCVATLTLVTAYMYLANLEAVPFTGRNAYLMAVNSIGDFAEAMALFGLAAIFLREPLHE